MKKIIILFAITMNCFSLSAQDWIEDGELMSSVRSKLNALKAEVDTLQWYGSDSLWKRDDSRAWMYLANLGDSVSIGNDTATEKLDVDGNMKGDTIIATNRITIGMVRRQINCANFSTET